MYLPSLLSALSLTIARGEVVLLGPSGSGKSSVLRLLLGFRRLFEQRASTALYVTATEFVRSVLADLAWTGER